MTDTKHAGPELLDELRAAVGYMRNAKIDLEAGARITATAIRTIDGGIKRAEAAIAKAIGDAAKATGAA